jgi:trehalose 6-phosphate phosphatase
MGSRAGPPSILSRRHRPVLARFAEASVLVAFDYDGTLAPIAPTPARARMRATTRRLLTRLAKRYPSVVISGRPLDDLARRLRHVPVLHLVGEHGFESAGRSRRSPTRVREWAVHMRELLPSRKGLVIEEKRNTITVHYRQAHDRRRLAAAIASAARRLPDARAIGGIEAISLVPANGPDKGVALQEARRSFGCDAAIYVGDDDSDEDAFRSAGPGRLLSIRVGACRGSAARYRLDGQQEIDALLTALLELRAPGHVERGRRRVLPPRPRGLKPRPTPG